ncbi:MAG: hypothetical protein II086_08200 [Ruminococcus sp.]|nr:hypothetical protein [Ruminococcus sp.]
MRNISNETTFIKVVLKPLAPYFFGNERGLKYDDNDTQMGNASRYFIQSNALPNQSALLGALRYLGIEVPDSSYRLSEADEGRIGTDSFKIDETDQKFGMIQKISPLYLMENEDKSLFFPAPFFISAVQTGDQAQNHVYEALNTDCGERWIPAYFREKTVNFDQFIKLKDGSLIKGEDIFRYQTRIVINRKRRYRGSAIKYDKNDKDFIKKQYVVMDGFSFVYYAEVTNAFFEFLKPRSISTVFLGQGKCPFAVSISDAGDEGKELTELTSEGGKMIASAVAGHLSGSVQVSSETKPCSYAFFVSDMFYEGTSENLKKDCQFAMTLKKQYRVFTTNYNRDGRTFEAVSNKAKSGRFLRENSYYLMQAGSCFLFENAGQMDSFRNLVEKMKHFENARKAGFNGIYYYDPNRSTEEET